MADDDPDLTPEQEERVRRLLTEARHTEPMPGNVAARLDRVIAGLARGDEVAPVVPLASRRRRRAVTMLVAAAAVVVGGIGVGQLLGSAGGGSSDSASSRPASAEDAHRSADSGAGGDSLATPRPQSGLRDQRLYALTGPVRVRPDHFSRDVRHAQGRLLSPSAGVADGPGYSSQRNAEKFPCAPGDWGAGLLVPASYRGEPTVLVFRPVRGDTQVVDLFQCGTDEALRSVTLPAR